MTLNADQVNYWAERLAIAHASSSMLAPISDSLPITMADAYAIQRALTERRVAEGDPVVGWKLGYTSRAMRTQMGVEQPNFGPLTSRMIVGNNAAVGHSTRQPRVEPEIAIRFGRRLAGKVSRADVLTAIAGAFACLEVVDSSYPDYRFQIEDNTADGSSAAFVVLGPRLPDTMSLENIGVVLRLNGRVVQTAAGAAAAGNPLDAIAWLVEALAEAHQSIEAGQIVITGGLTAAVSLELGDWIEADFGGRRRVATSREKQI